MLWGWPTQQQYGPDESAPKQAHVRAVNEMNPQPKNQGNILIERKNSTPTDREDLGQKDLKQSFTLVDSEVGIIAKENAKTVVAGQFPELQDSIYPSKMSCSNCFDQAFYCSSAIGQLNNIYRYGGLRSCSDLWAQWRFCMRMKALSEETKRIQIREFNKQKSAKYKLGPSSEDVWEIRMEPVDNAFTKMF